MTSISERFWEKVDRSSPGECWEWEAAKIGGYGVFWYEGSNVRAHRFSYTMEYEHPGDELVLHECDNPSCVNPDHLFLGDHADNQRDKAEKGRAWRPLGEEAPCAKLTEEEVSEILREYEAGDVYQTELADEYGVDQSLISKIVNGKYWPHVDRGGPSGQ